MQVRIKPGNIHLTADQAIVLGCFEAVERLTGRLKAVDLVLGGEIGRLLEVGDFAGQLGQTAVLYPHGALKSQRVILTGLGKREEVTGERLRRAYGFAGRKIRELRLESVSASVPESIRPKIKLEQAAQAMVEGILLSNYKLDRYKSGDESRRPALGNLTIVEEDRQKIAEIERGIRQGETFAWTASFTRDLANQPANYLTPERFAGEAEKLAKESNLRCEIFSSAQIRKLGMNALLAVGAGSSQSPKLVVLEYSPPKRAINTLALVGKGITFDAGGLSLKQTENMLDMKGDMMGGAVVMSGIAACAKMKLPLHLVGIVPAAENLPSGTAQKIGDIITSHSGKTIEVLNTDAEGRLILADALSFAQSFKPDAIIDVATLTAAIKTALGSICAGFFSNHPRLRDRIVKAGELTGERVWEMPLWDEYREFLKSDLADIKNVGGKWGGAILAATFLKTFVGDFPWLHLDIAGVDFTDKDDCYFKDDSYWTKGATGFGARLLLQFLKDWERI
ncbi:MAG: leucyl aminopeptidase [Candidatus Zixiibacteriota bacterium]